MKSQTNWGTGSMFDMERLARIFTWLTAGLLIFMLGMIFMNIIDAAAVNGTASTTSGTATTNPAY